MNRLMMLFALGALTATAAASTEPATSALEGRWQGVIAIPGRPVDATLDIQRKSAHEWIGSTDLTQLKLRGATLSGITVAGADVTADLANELGGPGETKATYVAHLSDDGALHGEFHQAGNSAPFVLTRVGAAQVQLPRARGVVPKSMEGRWRGDFIGSGNYPRHVTITLSNPGGDGTQAQFVSVGKRTLEIPVSWLGFGDGFLEIESPIGIGYEGRLSADRRHLVGVAVVGGDEFALNLEHAP
jgi:hypothetical protein